MLQKPVFAFACVMAAAPAYSQSRIVTVDLADGPGTTETRPIAPSNDVSIVVINRVAEGGYSASVVREPIPIPELPGPTRSLVKLTAACPALTSAETLKDQTEETNVRTLVALIRSKEAACSPAEQVDVNALIATTRYTLPDRYEVARGERLTITVTRVKPPAKVWTVIVTTSTRGSWRALYGMGFVPNRDDRFYLAAGDQSGQFVITKKREDSDHYRDLRVIPSVFFEWLSHSRELRDWSVSPTLGVGVKEDAPGFFGGVSITYNQNLSLIAGFPVYRQLRLNGQYRDGQTVKENLTDDQLYTQQYRPHYWFIGGAFRFSSNPFAAGGEGKKRKGP